jgi:hypothetical protein
VFDPLTPPTLLSLGAAHTGRPLGDTVTGPGWRSTGSPKVRRSRLVLRTWCSSRRSTRTPSSRTCEGLLRLDVCVCVCVCVHVCGWLCVWLWEPMIVVVVVAVGSVDRVVSKVVAVIESPLRVVACSVHTACVFPCDATQLTSAKLICPMDAPPCRARSRFKMCPVCSLRAITSELAHFCLLIWLFGKMCGHKCRHSLTPRRVPHLSHNHRHALRAATHTRAGRSGAPHRSIPPSRSMAGGTWTISSSRTSALC